MSVQLERHPLAEIEWRRDIEDLIDLVDRAWVDKQVVRHRQFQKEMSPRDLWSHQKPKTSPLIPAISEFRNPRGHYQDSVLGYWYGDPIAFLAQVATQVSLFKDYWSGPTLKARQNNLRYLLRNPSRFPSFLHELRVATDYKLQDDYQVEPLFFDPSASKGSPDILLVKDSRRIGIQCKARSPTEAFDLPFDMFQYLVGCLLRGAEDVHRNLRFAIDLKGPLTIHDVNEVASFGLRLSKTGLDLPYPVRREKYSLAIKELRLPARGLSDSQVKEEVESTPGNNFVVGAGLNRDAKSGLSSGLVLVSLSAPRPLEHVPWVVGTASEAAMRAPKNIVTIVALHTFDNTNYNSTDGKRLANNIGVALRPIFQRHTHIQEIAISSNHQRYVRLGSQVVQSQTQVVIFTNPYFS